MTAVDAENKKKILQPKPIDFEELIRKNDSNLNGVRIYHQPVLQY